jgi:uncharacterized protein (DUF58 family)
MILPTRKLLLLLAAPVAVLVLWSGPTMLALAAAYDFGVLLFVVLDLALSARPGQLAVERFVPEHLSIGRWNKVGWEVRNRSRVTVPFEITEDLPKTLERDTPRVAGRLLAHARAELRYGVRPTRRGQYVLGDIFLRYRTQLGLLVRQIRTAVQTPVKVYPDVASLARYELAAQRHRLMEMGLKAVRQRGQGSLFEGLREYVSGDDLADVAWKATARHGRMITRTYETERSQNVLIVLDCGRLMTAQVDRLSRLDYAINASLLLTYVAMKQGDYVGMVAFSDRIEGYVPPVKGRAAMSRMNEALYQLEARLREPNYEQVCRFLALRHRKRSLIVILTDVIDREASSMLLAYTARFARHHLPLCVTLRNLQVERIALGPVADVADCYSKTVALQMLARRGEALRQMRQAGVDVLDAPPRELTPQLLNRYLVLKQRQRL